ncbi:GNAT family N-acetyltransferase [Haloferula sp. A504]|uniref:GNAT family N-acetyltransferase n=1 Tax=Haloferula sp. A504 TaxID=3373601 RepID=UPI0031C7F032|nr:GNAT family N-acetyltransferase [Verrucomicrobiaceae bacterium E54]
MSGLRSEPLASSHDRVGFTCGVVALDDYLRRQASQDVRRHVAAVFVMVDEGDPGTVLGYYTLASYAVETRGLPEEVAKKLPRYPTTPATLIGRLARSIDQSGMGSVLLADALRRALVSTEQIGSALVVVEAKDDSAAAFYRKHGFLDFPQEKRKLFLPMKTVVAAVGKSG